MSPEYAETTTLNKEQEGDIVIDASGNRIVYLLPFYDTLDIFKGTAQFFVSLSSIERFLIKNGTLEAGSPFYLFKEKGYIFGVDNETISSLSESISTAWEAKSNELILEPLVQTEDDEKLYLFSRYVQDIGFIGYILPERVFVLSEPLKIILMVSFFVTTFLLLFLLLSLRQDKVMVLSERIKRFQINFLKEYVQNKEQLDWDRWKSELVLRREEVKSQIKRGIGSLKEQEEEEIDGLIDRSWDEIIRVIGYRAERGQQEGRLSGPVEIANIEEVVEKVLSRGNIVLPPGSVTTQSPAMTQGKGSPATSAGTGEESQETGQDVPDFTAGMKPVDVEEVTDEEERGEVEEALEYEEVEELGETEELTDTGELEEAEELEEVEEVTDLEEVEEKQASEDVEAEDIEESKNLVMLKSSRKKVKLQMRSKRKRLRLQRDLLRKKSLPKRKSSKRKTDLEGPEEVTELEAEEVEKVEEVVEGEERSEKEEEAEVENRKRGS